MRAPPPEAPGPPAEPRRGPRPSARAELPAAHAAPLAGRCRGLRNRHGAAPVPGGALGSLRASGQVSAVGGGLASRLLPGAALPRDAVSRDPARPPRPTGSGRSGREEGGSRAALGGGTACARGQVPAGS